MRDFRPAGFHKEKIINPYLNLMKEKFISGIPTIAIAGVKDALLIVAAETMLTQAI